MASSFCLQSFLSMLQCINQSTNLPKENIMNIEKFKKENADFLNSEQREKGWMPYTKLGQSTARLYRKVEADKEMAADLKTTLLKALKANTSAPNPPFESDENTDWDERYKRAQLKYRHDCASVLGEIVRKEFRTSGSFITAQDIKGFILRGADEASPFTEALKYIVEAIDCCLDSSHQPPHPVYFDIWAFVTDVLFNHAPAPFKIMYCDEWCDILSIKVVKKDGELSYYVDIGHATGPIEIVVDGNWCNFTYKNLVSSICIPSQTPLEKAQNVFDTKFVHSLNLDHNLPICPILHSIMGIYHIWECMDISRNESGYIDESSEPVAEVPAPEVIEEPVAQITVDKYIAAVEEFKDYVRKTVALHKLEGAKYEELPTPLKELLNLNAVADLLLSGANLELPENMKAAMHALEIPIV